MIDANDIIKRLFNNMPFIDDVLDGNTEILRQILDNKKLEPPQIIWIYILTFSDIQKDGQYVRHFLNKYLNMHDYNKIASIAIFNDYINIFKCLIKKKVHYNTLMFWAIYFNKINMVKLLLPKIIEINQAMNWANYHNRTEIYNLLVKNKNIVELRMT